MENIVIKNKSVDFLKTVLDNPNKMLDFTNLDIDPETHDFTSENLSDRLYSLQSSINVLVSYYGNNDDKVVVIKSILEKYDIELRFLREVNKLLPITIESKESSCKDLVNKFYNKMIFDLRDRNLSKTI